MKQLKIEENTNYQEKGYHFQTLGHYAETFIQHPSGKKAKIRACPMVTISSSACYIQRVRGKTGEQICTRHTSWIPDQSVALGYSYYLQPMAEQAILKWHATGTGMELKRNHKPVDGMWLLTQELTHMHELLSQCMASEQF